MTLEENLTNKLKEFGASDEFIKIFMYYKKI